MTTLRPRFGFARVFCVVVVSFSVHILQSFAATPGLRAGGNTQASKDLLSISQISRPAPVANSRAVVSARASSTFPGRLPGRVDGGCRLPQWLEPAIARGGGEHGRSMLSLAKRRIIKKDANATSAGAAGGHQLLVTFESSETEDSGSPIVLVDCSVGKALVFVHIPKNAGCHIESTARAGGVLWGAVKVRSAPFASESVRAPDGSTCSAWHLPPYLYHGAMYKNSEVFCVLRDPAARAVSEYRWRQDIKWPGTPLSCDEGSMSSWVQKQISRTTFEKFHSDCHWVPQVDYVRNPNTLQKTCHVMLKLSNLEQQFNTLMKRRGLALRMQPSQQPTNKANSCPWLTQAQLSPSALRQIRSSYSGDYDLLVKAGIGLIPPRVSEVSPKQQPIGRPKYTKPLSPSTKGEPSLQAPSVSRSTGTSLRAQPNMCMRAVTRHEAGYLVQSGDTLGLGQCGGAAEQSFVIHEDHTVRLKLKPGLCLSVFLRSTLAVVGDKLGMYPCSHDASAWSQRFVAPPDGTIRLAAPRARHLCLSIFLAGDEASPSDEIGLYTCTGAWNQVFGSSAIR